MAEYFTYACDIEGCGNKEAQRYAFPCVDREYDPSGNGDCNVAGYVDLCDKHQMRIFEVLLLMCDSMTTQRQAWRMLLGKERIP
jgi:hypothetical protein